MKKKESAGTAAVLTIRDAGKMTLDGRKQIAQWLRKQAKDLITYGDRYAKIIRMRYIYLAVNKHWIVACPKSKQPSGARGERQKLAGQKTSRKEQ
ncbi:MAG: hypothetical protein WC554_15105 [Clostridia bacterium]|jgi:hypothetical protein|nr:hypothetical protein [Phycisphaerae bacterium]